MLVKGSLNNGTCGGQKVNIIKDNNTTVNKSNELIFIQSDVNSCFFSIMYERKYAKNSIIK